MTTENSPQRVRFGTQVDAEVLESARATVLALQRLLGPRVSLASFTTDALAEHVRRAEREYNDGQPFGSDGARLPTGPRIGAGDVAEPPRSP
ncbi:hypothetical protein [Nocardioides sp. GXZ039]|uniref:hypothetical protein n=1 Tax=Nocardioides sp. GXZ039 TaxID=3136018 RepID=UPI0030F3CC26